MVKIQKGGVAFLLAVLLGLLPACTKNTTPKSLAGKQQDYSRLSFVVQDNYTYSLYYQGLVASGYADTLADNTGPYTILVPNNDAMVAGKFSYSNNSVNYFLQAFDPPLKDYVRYFIIPQKVSFAALPLGVNQPFPTLQGTPVYITKYLNGKDTVITVNGVAVVPNAIDIPASNGLIDVITSVPEPLVYPNLWQRMLKDGSLAFFTTAAQRAGLQSFFEDTSQSLTVLAPSNYAFTQMYVDTINGLDLTSIASINAADPARVKDLLLYHVIKGIRFTNDFARVDTLPGDSVRLVMYNGTIMKYTGQYFFSNRLIPGMQTIIVNGQQVTVYTGPLGPASAQYFFEGVYNAPAISYSNRPTGNGVLQEITSVLYP